MKKVFGIAAFMLSLNAFAFANESGLLDKKAGIITKPSKFSVIETMDRVEAAAKGVGANIFARIDYQQIEESECRHPTQPVAHLWSRSGRSVHN